MLPSADATCDATATTDDASHAPALLIFTA
jgi:hypothetical protein